MLLSGSFLEEITLVACGGTLFSVGLHHMLNISPIQGVWFYIYLLLLFITSVLYSFKIIQWLLNRNKPFVYDLDDLRECHPILASFIERFPPRPLPESIEYKEYDTNELSVITTVLERRLVSSWYVPFVSQEIGFPFACKQLLDQMIGKTFQICSKIETQDVFVDTCSILTAHLKEYKKAQKRHAKSPDQVLEDHCKKTHAIYTNSDYSLADHCTKVLRVVLKELVPWELWGTPHSELLVRVLAKKLDSFIEANLIDPVWLNNKLVQFLLSKEQIDTTEAKDAMNAKVVNDVVPTAAEGKLSEVDGIVPEDDQKSEVNHQVDKEILKVEITTIESALSTLITQSTAPILQRPIDNFELPEVDERLEDIVEEMEVMKTDPMEITDSPVLRQRRGRQGRSEVKIYDRIIEGSVKTWETDVDLQCISLGQDLLAGLDGEITLSRLWGQDQDNDKNQPLWFGEDDTLEMELDSKEPSPVKKEHSPKPAELLKDLQSTVHQAKTKIGDLQVPKHAIDVPRNNDEAAGMMEGLLDFGIAGFRKGLRFTGLSDDSQEKSPSHQKDKERFLDKVSSLEAKGKPGTSDAKEAVVATLKEDSNGSSSVPQLVKQQRVASQDSVAARVPAKGESTPIAVPAESPEPEYEEAADLSTSIAKLRTLLQQRAEAQPDRSEEVWWESAEETRGRTQLHRSSKPVDTATLADEYDMLTDRSSPNQSSNMQKLDRLLHRTMTGMFNSLKTAVGAEAEQPTAAMQDAEWAYVCTSVDLGVCGAVSRLVGSRRALAHVDAATDSLSHLPLPPKSTARLVPDDFDEWCAQLGVGWSAVLELCVAAGLLHSHLATRMATLIAADIAQAWLDRALSLVGAEVRRAVFAAFEAQAETDAHDTTDTTMDKSTDGSHKSTYGSANNSTEKSAHISTKKSANSTENSTIKSGDYSTDKLSFKSGNSSTDKSANSTDKSTIKSGNNIDTSAKYADKPTDQTTDKANITDKSTDKSGDQSTDASAEASGGIKEPNSSSFDPEETCGLLLDRIKKYPLHQLLSDDTLSTSTLLVIRSLAHRSINRELICKLLDLAALHFHKAAALRHPSFDNN